jgi:methyl-accepting chemotaxis protein WspA
MVTATDSINAKLAALSEKASNINSVLITITKVADQTNILSLNAAIEAEKAGEAGRGFSVVATEIRRLADQTSVSTWDIEQMLKEMQSAVSASVMGMDKFSEEIRRSVGEVRQVTNQLSGVMDQVQKLAPQFDQVLQGMQSSHRRSQINETMMQLNDATQQTVESLKSTSEAVHQLQYAAGGCRAASPILR